MEFMIILLAMVAAFLGLRLYSVLGKRTGAEQDFVRPVEGGAGNTPPRPVAARPEPHVVGGDTPRALDMRAETGLRAIVQADRSFNITAFAGGAQAAYKMILEAYWSGDKDALRDLTDDDVYASFVEAIDARAEKGEVMENRLLRIEEARIVDAALEGGEAQVTVRFVSDIAALVRNAEGAIIAGSMTDAVEETDVWTFARDVRSQDPNWRLIDTDAE